MSEAELHWMHQRLQGGKLAQAEQGRLRFRLPIGLIYDPVGRIVFDPDEAVVGAVRLVFTLFEQHQTAWAVVRHFASHQLRFPTRHWGGGRAGELKWIALTHSRVLSLLHSPLYAGAYVYGRTQTRSLPLPGEEPRIKGRTSRVKLEDWPIVLLDRHPEYISWEQFRRNQLQLADNQKDPDQSSRGVVRQGPSLLQGIVLCGCCGRRMSVSYQGKRSLLLYQCQQAHTQLAVAMCQSMRGDCVDQAVVDCFLQALAPAHLEVALSALKSLEARAKQMDQQARRQIERAQYEADLAGRRYRVVDPENRLVARSLEREWNEKLAEVDRMERAYQLLPKPAVLLLTAQQREQIRKLAADLPALWEAETTTHAHRKQLLRWLIKDVTLEKRDQAIEIHIRWQTEASTTLGIPLPPKMYQTPAQVVSRIRELAPTHTDTQIALLLNKEGHKAGKGGAFTRAKVEWLRFSHRIAHACPESLPLTACGQRGDGRYSARAASQLLNVVPSTIAEWCKTGRLESVQAKVHGPRWILLTPEIISSLRKPAKQES